jgi:hypothetical protein
MSIKLALNERSGYTQGYPQPEKQKQQAKKRTQVIGKQYIIKNDAWGMVCDSRRSQL